MFLFHFFYLNVHMDDSTKPQIVVHKLPTKQITSKYSSVTYLQDLTCKNFQLLVFSLFQKS